MLAEEVWHRERRKILGGKKIYPSSVFMFKNYYSWKKIRFSEKQSLKMHSFPSSTR